MPRPSLKWTRPKTASALHRSSSLPARSAAAIAACAWGRALPSPLANLSESASSSWISASSASSPPVCVRASRKQAMPSRGPVAHDGLPLAAEGWTPGTGLAARQRALARGERWSARCLRPHKEPPPLRQSSGELSPRPKRASVEAPAGPSRPPRRARPAAGRAEQPSRVRRRRSDRARSLPKPNGGPAPRRRRRSLPAGRGALAVFSAASAKRRRRPATGG